MPARRFVVVFTLFFFACCQPSSAEGLGQFWSHRGSPQQQAYAGKPSGSRAGFWGRQAPERAPETVANDRKLAELSRAHPVEIEPGYEIQSVRFKGYKAGTIVIDTKARFLYLVEGWGKARRYPIAVGREGLLFTGEATIGAKQEWPRWFPTKDMIKREPGKYARYAEGMDGGLQNPLGARALYLYQGKRDTYIRIHGTNQPRSIGSAASNGCFRMYNGQVMDLYDRVRFGAPVVVL